MGQRRAHIASLTGVDRAEAHEVRQAGERPVKRHRTLR